MLIIILAIDISNGVTVDATLPTEKFELIEKLQGHRHPHLSVASSGLTIIEQKPLPQLVPRISSLTLGLLYRCASNWHFGTLDMDE